MKLLSKETVAQRVTPGRIGWFRKELIEVRGPEPLAVVRKRRLDGHGHGAAHAEGETLAPIILVHGFGQNRYAWHIPERSMSNYLAELGFDVFNVDLRGHGRSALLGAERSRGVDDYIRGDLPAVIDRVLALTGHARVFMMGHSLGGLCAAAAAARQPERVAGVITMGPPHALGRGHFVLGNMLRLASAARSCAATCARSMARRSARSTSCSSWPRAGSFAPASTVRATRVSSKRASCRCSQ
jgi:polyhydroxyalkanoate synthase subunit PhaC